LTPGTPGETGINLNEEEAMNEPTITITGTADPAAVLADAGAAFVIYR